MQISLAERCALVTGAGRGIGKAIATKLASSGASVLLADVDLAALSEARDAITSAGGRAEILCGDLTQADVPDKLVAEALGCFGSLDIIVNNAGYTWDNVIQKTTDEQFQAMLDIHVTTPFRVLRAASEFLRTQAKREKEQGAMVMRKVVNITSISGIDGNAGQAGYSSGKAAVIGLTKTLAKEWGRYNITVNAVGFGLIDTRLIRPMDDPQTHVTIGNREIQVGMQSGSREAMIAQIPLGRLGTADDAANAVFFFCSPLSDYVTGEVLVCGGGVGF
jgi:3-oxoacyl-[acyl-carrier protein] reductase